MSWFVEFDPVRARVEGRNTGLPQDLAGLCPDRMMDSDMAEIPAGRTAPSLGKIATSRRTGIDSGKVASDTPYLGLQHIPRRSVAPTDWGGTGSVSGRESAFKTEDLLAGKLRPYFQEVGVAPVDGLCSTDIAVLMARIPKWSSFALACVLSSAFIAHTSQDSTGTKVPRTSSPAMSAYQVGRLPKLSLQSFSTSCRRCWGKAPETSTNPTLWRLFATHFSPGSSLEKFG